MHVTMKIGAGLPSLREKRCLGVVMDCFRAGCDRFGFRLVHYTVQHNHFHLLCEAEDERALSAGMRGLAVRLSMNLNRHWGRRGQVFPERYHAVQLTNLLQVRNAIAYVLMNHLKHGLEEPSGRIDPACSGWWFDGWAESELRAMCRALNERAANDRTVNERTTDGRTPDGPARHGDEGERGDTNCTPVSQGRPAICPNIPSSSVVAPVVAPRTWQLGQGWKLHYPLVSVDEIPQGRA